MKCKCIKKRSYTGFLEVGKVYEAKVRKVAGKMLRKEKAKPPAKRSWIYPRMEALEPQQLTINFKTE